MRTQTVFACLAAALSAPVFAAPASMPAAEQPAAAQFRLYPDQVQDMRADYRLADGRTLKVQDQQARLFMTLDGKREELQRVGPNQFVSHDSGTRLTFDQLPFADKVEVARAGE